MEHESEWLARMQTQADRTRKAYSQCSIARSALPRDEATVFEADERCRNEERVFNDILDERGPVDADAPAPAVKATGS